MKGHVVGSALVSLCILGRAGTAGDVTTGAPRPFPVVVARTAQPLPRQEPIAVSLGSPTVLNSPNRAVSTAPKLPSPAIQLVAFQPPAVTTAVSLPPTETVEVKAQAASPVSPPAGLAPMVPVNTSSMFAVDSDNRGSVVLTQVVTPAPVTVTPPRLAQPQAVITEVVPGSEYFERHAWHSPELMGGPVPSRFYVDAEYLLWWTKGDRVPPLVTTGPPITSNGILGREGTVILFGNETLDPSARSGGRFTAGAWLGSCEPAWAFEFTGFFLAPKSVRFAASSPGDTILARPFFDVNTRMQLVQIVAGPGVAEGGVPVVSAGSVAVEDTSRLWGLEPNFRYKLCCDCWYRVDLLLGARYLDLDEGLNILEALQISNGESRFVSDRFATRNQFAGPQVGMSAQFQRGRLTVDLRGRVALGDTHQVVNIEGNSVIIPAGAPPGSAVGLTGGLLALPTNIGQFSRDRMSVVPELGVQVGYQVTPHLRAFAGYSFLWWTNVLRPGDQIDLQLDQALIPAFNPNPLPPTGLHKPAVPFRESDYWAQGFNFGLEFRY